MTHVRMVGAQTLKGAACGAGSKQLSLLRTASHSEQGLRVPTDGRLGCEEQCKAADNTHHDGVCFRHRGGPCAKCEE